MKSIISICAAVTLSAVGMCAEASPCSGIDRALSNERKAVLEPIIAKQLHDPSAKILKNMNADGWSVIYVLPPNSEPAFLFFRGAPESGRYKTLWDGAATIDEEQAIRQWATDNVPGIPPRLAACFAWFVTPPHRDQ